MKRNYIKILPVSLVLSVILILYVSSGSYEVKNLSDIIFSHQFHIEDMETECISCHIDIESSTSSLNDNLPTMDECASCHDIEDDELCGMCHRNVEEPAAVERMERELLFNHQVHIEQGTTCETCHVGIIQSNIIDKNYLPLMDICFSCHNGEKADNSCDLCHTKLTLADIHPVDWRHQHGDQASSDRDWCLACHTKNEFCIDCHFGDNINGKIHELNFQYTHGLDAQSKDADCAKCHSREMFCVACHESGNRMPMAHSTTNWLSRHGDAAKEDVENCASCHLADDLICASSGCHSDFDGIRGNDNKIHADDLSIFDSEKGPWHNNDDYYCFQCHLNTKIEGTGFCGYCH